MAWLQNLAGKAEDFLNKIDQNAATVLNEPQSSELETSQSNIIELPVGDSPIQFHSTPSIEIIDEINRTATPYEEEAVGEIESNTSSTPPLDIDIFERPLKTNTSTVFSSKSSSYNLLEDQVKYEEQISKLEKENEELNKQILNLQHEYSELQYEFITLQSQVQTYKESAQQAQNQMEEYKIRAQRILQEKEKFIVTKQVDSDTQSHILAFYNEELKKELQFQIDCNNELSMKNSNLTKEVIMLQQQYVSVQNNNHQSNQELKEKLSRERKLRANCEEECRLKTKEMQVLQMEVSSLQNTIKAKENVIYQLKEQLHHYSQRSNSDIETRLQTLTQTLMLKQNTLETITSERNALKIQLEKLETNYDQLLKQKQRTVVNVNSNSEDSRAQVPRLMEMSPLDVGVTRKVKHAYSTLDAISIRTGVFLRRYPLARIFVLCYMILLHVWVLIILFNYVPSSH